MSLGGEGGPSSTPYNPMIQGGMAGGVADAGKQMWLCGWLPVLDFKPFTPMSEICPF
ncbi:MAG: hypothetical protein LRY50_14235 [Geovibrio sp.]|nr:hypothetical protein [Geovibrio sp.]